MQVSENVFEFVYNHLELGEEVIVEATANIYQPYANPDSDWDAKQHVEVTKVEVWLSPSSKLDSGVRIDIPEDVIYSEICAQIRAAELTRAFDEEDGGF